MKISAMCVIALALEPGLLAHGGLWILSYAVRSNLTEIAPGGKVVSNLAESWESSDGAKKWVFTLRRGVEFHNGKSVTGQDVVASINHHRGEGSKSAAKLYADGIQSLSVDGDKIVIELEQGNADLPSVFANADFGICPSDGEGKIDWQSGIGSGSYVLKNWEPGVVAKLERNRNFWNPDRGYADDVELLTVLDPAARVSALMSKSVDVIDQVDVKAVGRLSQSEGVVVDEADGAMHFCFPMRTDTPPFDNNNVRLALKHAVDREAMLKKILLGHGKIGNDTPIGKSYRYFAEDLEPFPYDPDKAKWHLRQAGLTSLSVDLSAADAGFPGAVDASVLYKELARPAGIEINAIREPNDGYWTNVWMQKPWSVSYWGGYPTEDEMLSAGYAAGAKWNDTYWKHEKFNSLLNRARSELDDDKRRSMYVEMQHLIRDEGGNVVPMFANYIMARRSNIAHGDLGSDRGLDGYRMCERWWLA